MVRLLCLSLTEPELLLHKWTGVEEYYETRVEDHTFSVGLKAEVWTLRSSLLESTQLHLDHITFVTPSAY